MEKLNKNLTFILQNEFIDWSVLDDRSVLHFPPTRMALRGCKTHLPLGVLYWKLNTYDGSVKLLSTSIIGAIADRACR